MIERRNSRVILLGNIPVGGNNPIVIQSMTNTKTCDVNSTSAQIRKLEQAGCEIVRVAVPDQEAAAALPEIIRQSPVPLIADIHFDHRLALSALKAGIHGLRLNPGNIGSSAGVKEIVAAARERKIPIRIGVNSGSIAKEKLHTMGLKPETLVESALEHVHILEKAGYHEIKISVKASSVPLTLDSYRLLSKKVDYPFHIGITEAGSEFSGTIKSAIGIGILLNEGIGDTIRVSLTAAPHREISVAREILKSLELKKGLKIISCPTCGRTEIDLIQLTRKAEHALRKYRDLDLTVAIMGCIVNGPGEAREADFGIAGGKNEGLLFKKGKILRKVPEADLLKELIKLIESA